MGFFIKLSRHVNKGERMNSIDFGDHRSKVTNMKGTIGKCGLRRDALFSLLYFI